MSLPMLRGVDPVVGWRGWNLYKPGLLVSPNTVWMTGERMEAGCSYSEHDRYPEERCSCGIYAFKEASDLFEQKYNNQAIYGELWMWGKVVECERGWRAEYAYPKALYACQTHHLYDKESGRLLAEYAAFRYGVGLTWIGEGHEIIAGSEEVRRRQEELCRQIEAEKKAAKVVKGLATRQNRLKLEAKAASLPANDPKYKNLLEEIEAEVKRLTS